MECCMENTWHIVDSVNNSWFYPPSPWQLSLVFSSLSFSLIKFLLFSTRITCTRWRPSSPTATTTSPPAPLPHISPQTLIQRQVSLLLHGLGHVQSSGEARPGRLFFSGSTHLTWVQITSPTLSHLWSCPLTLAFSVSASVLYLYRLHHRGVVGMEGN